MPIRLTTERWLALIIAFLSLIVLFFAFQVPEPSTFMPVGPRLFPVALGAAMLLSALLLFVLPPRKAAPETAEQATAEHIDAAGIERVTQADEEGDLEWRRVLSLIALTFVYVLLFSVLGFILSTVPFIVGAAKILGSRHLLRDSIVAAGVAVGIYFLFTGLLHVGLPPIPFLEI
jgi:putative tricarboxylic transport membrane protein